VIAEIGVNHEGKLDLAKKLIDLAKEGGADAAKFQTYKADTLASKHSPAYWDLTKEPTTSQHQLFQKYDAFGPPEYRALAKHCEKVEIDFVSTPFDSAAVELLDPLMPFFKIASADLTNTPLLRQVAETGKPVVLSTGASTLAEVTTAVDTLRAAGCEALSLLHCVLNYPTADENAHLGMITGLRRDYPDIVIGYSDHTVPDDMMTALTTSYLLGARVIEKHFTHDKSLPGNDHYHAMDSADLRTFIANVQKIELLIGSGQEKEPIATEEISRVNARRSIVLDADVRAGQTLTESMLTYKRPGTGVSPLHWDSVIGRVAARDLERDHVLQWEDLV
jgi:N-acetylneuraminate synthase